MGVGRASATAEYSDDRFGVWRDCAAAAGVVGWWRAADAGGGSDTDVSRGGAADADAVGWRGCRAGCGVENGVAASRWEPCGLRAAAGGDAGVEEPVGRT